MFGERKDHVSLVGGCEGDDRLACRHHLSRISGDGRHHAGSVCHERCIGEGVGGLVATALCAVDSRLCLGRNTGRIVEGGLGNEAGGKELLATCQFRGGAVVIGLAGGDLGLGRLETEARVGFIHLRQDLAGDDAVPHLDRPADDLARQPEGHGRLVLRPDGARELAGDVRGHERYPHDADRLRRAFGSILEGRMIGRQEVGQFLTVGKTRRGKGNNCQPRKDPYFADFVRLWHCKAHADVVMLEAQTYVRTINIARSFCAGPSTLQFPDKRLEDEGASSRGGAGMRST